MVRITLHCRTTSARGTTNLRFRVLDGSAMPMWCSTGRKVPNAELAAFTPEGTLRPRVTVYNPELKSRIDEYFHAIGKAYADMKASGMDMRSEVLHAKVEKIIDLDSRGLYPAGGETLVGRFRHYVDMAERDGIIGRRRRMCYDAMYRRLERFLYIKGHSAMRPEQFDVEMLMAYREFVANEYQYVARYPKLYVKGGRRRYPTRRLSGNSVVHELKGLRAFFNELEISDEMFKSPFRKISRERSRSIMRMRHDEPFFLRKEEFLRVAGMDVPSELQTVKDMFVLNCCLGARIGDFMRLSMDKVAVSPSGIPYVRYIPHKTMKIMENVHEIRTPLVRAAYDIVMRTRFDFRMPGQQRFLLAAYNVALRKLLEYCGIDRPVAKFSESLGENEYFPLYLVAGSRLARKTHVDMMNKVQVDAYVAGLHAEGSDAVRRYTSLELEDRFALMNVAFAQPPYRVRPDLSIEASKVNAGVPAAVSDSGAAIPMSSVRVNADVLRPASVSFPVNTSASGGISVQTGALDSGTGSIQAKGSAPDTHVRVNDDVTGSCVGPGVSTAVEDYVNVRDLAKSVSHLLTALLGRLTSVP